MSVANVVTHHLPGWRRDGRSPPWIQPCVLWICVINGDVQVTALLTAGKVTEEKVLSPEITYLSRDLNTFRHRYVLAEPLPITNVFIEIHTLPVTND